MYNGEYKDGLMDGYGYYKYANGSLYEGERVVVFYGFKIKRVVAVF